MNEKKPTRTTSASKHIEGPWLSREAMDNLPEVKRDFDRNRDPYLRAQMDDEEPERQGQSGKTRIQDKPKPEPKPKGQMRRAAERAAYVDGWLSQQRKQAMSKAPEQKAFGKDEMAPRRSVRARHR